MEKIIIVRSSDYSIIDVIKTNNKNLNSLETISNYVQKKYDRKKAVETTYDIGCKKEYIYREAKLKKKLNLDIDFDELTFEEYYTRVKNVPLTVNSIMYGGGIGGPGWLDELLNINGLFSVIIYILRTLYQCILYIFPFYKIKREYGYGKNFITEIIIKSEIWNEGLFDLKDIKYNKIIEKSIMKKLKYKLKNKKWINEGCYEGAMINKYQDY